MKGTGCAFFMTFRNMAVVRLCFVFVLFFCVDLIAGKPLFGFLFCDYIICDDDDVSTTTSSSDDDDWGCDCGPRRRPTTRPPTATAMPPIPPGFPPGMPFGQMNPINVVIPPGRGMNMTMYQSGQNIYTFWDPMREAPAPPPGPPVVTPAPPSTLANQPTTAGATPAGAPAATTAATTVTG